MKETVLKRLHKTQIEILDEIDRICKKNDITYFLESGTLLGAVRHEGFIPWDDDIDIGMLRKDFEKFTEVCTSKSPHNIFLTTLKTEKLSHVHTNVQKRNTLFIEKKNLYNYKTHDYRKGIFIDIFIYDNVSNRLLYSLRKATVNILNILIYGKHNTGKDERYSINGTAKKVKYRVAKILAIFFSERFLILRREAIFTRSNNNEECDYIASFGSRYKPGNCVFSREEMLPTSSALFEGKHYPAPKNPDYFLKVMYGEDYMQLPPIGKRVTHNPAILSFNTEEEYEEYALYY